MCSEYLSPRSIWLYVPVMSRTHFKVNPDSIVAWMSRNSLLEVAAEYEVELTAVGLEPRTTYFENQHWIIRPNSPNDWDVCWVLICTVHLTVSSCHVMYAFQSESTLYNYLNVKELLARNRWNFWKLSDCNWTRTQNHLVRQRTLNHLLKLTKWFSCILNTYLYGTFDCMFLSCQVRIWESMQNLYLPECQGTPCSK